MKLIVGLGNPDQEYQKTRHNVGFRFLDHYADTKGIRINKKKFDGYYNELQIEKEKVILLKPSLYMNLSGIVVKRYLDFFKINSSDMLIISDDLDMSLGRIKLRPTGTSGGHNGLKNIEENIKTKEYKRLKVGISNDKGIDTKDYVLGKFSESEEEIINTLDKKVVNIIDDFLKITFDELMAKYNGK